jgi:hypothetical protein
MAVPSGTDLLLFVAGEPGPPLDSMRDVETSIVGRMTGSIVGNWWRGRSGSPSAPAGSLPTQGADSASWHLPPQQIQVVNLVFDIARRMRKSVGLIDVNRPANHRQLVDWWVGPEGVLPLLVRPDGVRLQGMEGFSPGKVRRFIQGR